MSANEPQAKAWKKELATLEKQRKAKDREIGGELRAAAKELNAPAKKLRKQAAALTKKAEALEKKWERRRDVLEASAKVSADDFSRRIAILEGRLTAPSPK